MRRYGLLILIFDHALFNQTQIISSVYTQSQLLEKEVYLIDKIANRGRDKLKHLKCIFFARPVDSIIQSLVEELRSPLYGEYYLGISNVVGNLITCSIQ